MNHTGFGISIDECSSIIVDQDIPKITISSAYNECGHHDTYPSRILQDFWILDITKLSLCKKSVVIGRVYCIYP